MDKEKIKPMALIVARPGPLRDSLQVLLKATMRLDAVEAVDSSPAVLQTLAHPQPVVILIDFDLPDQEGPRLLARLKSDWPGSRYLVLTSHSRQTQPARAAGADAVLRKGTSAARLFETIKALVGSVTVQPGHSLPKQ